MKNLEERIWDYIDGFASPAEKIALEKLFASDPAVKSLYQQLAALNNGLADVDLDEPSMGFTRNVMDQVALEIKPVSLKTKIDLRIIYFVGGFFGLSIVAIFLFAVFTSTTEDSGSIPALDFTFAFPELLNATTLKIFLFVDLFIAMVYLDGVFRRKLNAQKKETAL